MNKMLVACLEPTDPIDADCYGVTWTGLKVDPKAPKRRGRLEGRTTHPERRWIRIYRIEIDMKERTIELFAGDIQENVDKFTPLWLHPTPRERANLLALIMRAKYTAAEDNRIWNNPGLKHTGTKTQWEE